MAGIGSFWLASRRAFLNDFNAGLHFYMAGDLSSARKKLNDALERRWPHSQVKELLVRVLLEDSLKQRRQGDLSQASKSLEQAIALAPAHGDVRQALSALRVRFEKPDAFLPRTTDEFLKALYAGTGRPLSVEGMDSADSSRRAQMLEDRSAFLEALAQSQEQWQAALDQQKARLTRIIYGSVVFFLALSGFLFICVLQLFRLLLGKKGLLSRVEGLQQQMAALHPATQWPAIAGPGVERSGSALVLRKIDAIEAELVNESDASMARQLLKTYLNGQDPWARARAAKALYRLDSGAAIETLKSLLGDTRREARFSAIWGFGELANREAVDILIPLVWQEDRQIQQAAVRCLVQMESRKQAGPEEASRIRSVLADIRAKTGWII